MKQVEKFTEEVRREQIASLKFGIKNLESQIVLVKHYDPYDQNAEDNFLALLKEHDIPSRSMFIKILKTKSILDLYKDRDKFQYKWNCTSDTEKRMELDNDIAWIDFLIDNKQKLIALGDFVDKL